MDLSTPSTQGLLSTIHDQLLPTILDNDTTLEILQISSGKVPTINNNSTVVKGQLLLYDVLIPMLGTIVILINLAVVISSGIILKKGQQPRSTYLFLGNVAMTDLLTGIAVIFGQLFPKQYRNEDICAVQIGMIVSSTVASVYSVGLIAIDRFLYILYGLQYQKWVYPTRARLLIGFTWIIGCLVGYMPLFGWRGNTDNGRVCWFIVLAPKKLIALTVCLGILPILLVITLYSVLLYHAIQRIILLRQANSAQPNSNSGNSNLRMFTGRPNEASSTDQNNTDQQTDKSFFHKIFKKKPSTTISKGKKWKAIKVVLFTSGSFVITWAPYFIASLVYVYTCDGAKRETQRCKSLAVVIASPLAILGFVNSLLNPIIYAWWHRGFRSFIKKNIDAFRMRRNNYDTGKKVDRNKSSTSNKTSTRTTESKVNSSTGEQTESHDP